MGWNSGQGLGANNQGQTEIVKVKMKDDNKGDFYDNYNSIQTSQLL